MSDSLALRPCAGPREMRTRLRLLVRLARSGHGSDVSGSSFRLGAVSLLFRLLGEMGRRGMGLWGGGSSRDGCLLRLLALE